MALHNHAEKQRPKAEEEMACREWLTQELGATDEEITEALNALSDRDNE